MVQEKNIFSKNIFSLIREKVDIVTVISDYVALHPVGNYFKGLSPFSQEKTPSFTVTPEKRIFYCFSTQVGGDVVDFISRVEGCSQKEAAYMLIKKYALAVPSDYQGATLSSKEVIQKELRATLYDFFSQWTSQWLKKSPHAEAYLQERGVNQAMITKYTIGYCPSSHFVPECIAQANKKNITVSDMIVEGILQRRDKKNSALFFTYEERIIFPIKNNFGIICGFGGRIFQEESSQEHRRPKYINSAANQSFSKKEVLYGLFEAKKSITQKEMVYLVEGFFDVIALAQRGYENTVATMGTACTKAHLITLSKFTTTITVLYDGDIAGQNAIEKLIPLCWELSLSLFVVPLPTKEDPASLGDAIGAMIARPVLATEYLIQRAMEGLSSMPLSKKIEKINALIAPLCQIDDPIKKMVIMKEIADSLQVPYPALAQVVQKNNLPILQKNDEEPKVKNREADEVPWHCLLVAYVCASSLSEMQREKIKHFILTYAPLSVSMLWKDMIKNSGQREDATNICKEIITMYGNDNETKERIMKYIQEGNWKNENLMVLLREVKKNVWKSLVMGMIAEKKLGKEEAQADSAKKIELMKKTFFEEGF